MGTSGNGAESAVDHITLSGYKAGDDEDFGWTTFEDRGEQEITDGEKCYLACFSNSFVPESAETILKDPGTMEKNDRVWMIYVVFSRKELK